MKIISRNKNNYLLKCVTGFFVKIVTDGLGPDVVNIFNK